MDLSPAALRVLGVLVEKERTTPEYYPMSVNGLVAACNQKTNRDPVLTLDEAQVDRALEGLREAGLAMRAAGGGRVVKYSHNVIGRLQTAADELALLAELMLRGPQTLGELRGRAERMHHFADLVEVDAALNQLMERTPPLVERLPRQPGQKEARYRHLLGGAAPLPVEHAAAAPHGDGDAREPATSIEDDRDRRIAHLESEVAELRAEVAALWREFRALTLQPE